MNRIGIVVGLADEARMLSNTPGFVECGGPGPAGARRAAKRALDSGAQALLSFGVAGALDPVLRPGQIVVATEIHRRGGAALPCNVAWRNRCIEALGTPPRGAIYGSDSPVGTAAEKQALFEATAAVAIDMESHAVAAAAAEAKLPFLAVRAIADSATQRIPVSLATCFDEFGEPRACAMLAAIFLHPGEIVLLPAARRGYREALAALARAVSTDGAALRNV